MMPTAGGRTVTRILDKAARFQSRSHLPAFLLPVQTALWHRVALAQSTGSAVLFHITFQRGHRTQQGFPWGGSYNSTAEAPAYVTVTAGTKASPRTGPRHRLCSPELADVAHTFPRQVRRVGGDKVVGCFALFPLSPSKKKDLEKETSVSQN